ncbi:uncharacterized protein PV09_00197 [Verruconis gallopava]|uniref:Uncharacterized protein n=1 Tax=Verruconis gallopava TaxID=253628 RepID=A0A0D1Y2J6_9PEZI|nr:uncharacterized protein PV09_00197 [Verruconis gallopava]KIW09276.1 hypothetical protein PV09_00197 [Verruconis gallopava]
MSRNDFPSQLFRYCGTAHRDGNGLHKHPWVRDLESRCQKALWQLIKLTGLYRPRLANERDLREYLQASEDELNKCCERLTQMPLCWREAFWSKRSELETKVNNWCGLNFGILPQLPWNLPPRDAETPEIRGMDGELLNDQNGYAGSAVQHSGAAVLLRSPADRFKPRRTVGQQRHPGSTYYPSRRQGPESRPKQMEHASQHHQLADITGVVGRTPFNLSFSMDVPLSQGSNRSSTPRTRPSTSAPRRTYEDLVEYDRREFERESINRDPARYGGIVNAFTLDEDPLSRPLQGLHKIITLVDEQNMPQHEFKLIYKQDDAQTRDLVTILETKLQADRESQRSKSRSYDVAINAIRRGVVQQVTCSDTAGGDIWVTSENRIEVVRVLLDLVGSEVGKWTLFGLGVGMSEGRLYLLQVFD